jgi:hypothetical protein
MQHGLDKVVLDTMPQPSETWFERITGCNVPKAQHSTAGFQAVQLAAKRM